ncbi:PREDICTED: kelch domain-containing protein 9 [Nanorana parkeri]|uniref:kelch domain-containing protein 9 n=1 Tax=Nanorana parkeri TaxID=125878 RepID=UPI0008546438|nr:PREDICTED: kelch domain-containing protein 9 [Nanorana parkeri]
MISSQWTWTPVAKDAQFARAFHTCTPIGGKLYLYGGIRSRDPKEPPLGDVVTFDPEQKSSNSSVPQVVSQRSHHDAAPLGERWLCVVGGWDGSQRLSSILSYDTETTEWATWTGEPSSNPPAGLSSHTCTKISDNELCIVGREGGLRTQRRYASVYTLRLNARSKTYSYKEEESHTASRSGHSAILLRRDIKRTKKVGYNLYVFGGRESSEVDVVGHWGAGKVQENAESCPRLTEQLTRLLSTKVAKRAEPKGLRYHSCSMIGPLVVVYGGETLSRSRDAVCNDLYVGDTRCSAVSWFHFPGSNSQHKRVGHRTCVLNDGLYLVGGFGGDGKTPCPEICMLEMSP